MRIRSDVEDSVSLDKTNFLSNFSVGLYYVNSNKDISYNNSYGFSVLASTISVITGLVKTFN